MALPDGVTTFTLTFGPYLDAVGKPVLKGLKGSLTPISDSGRPIRILHPDSGSMIVPTDIPFVIGDDGTASVDDLPHTDNESLFPHPFRYKVAWGESARAMSGSVVTPSNKPFAVPITSGTVVDFDKQMEALGQPGVQVTPLGVPAGGLTAEALVKNSDADFDTKWQSLAGYVTDDELADAIEGLNLPSYALDSEVTAAINAIDLTPYALDTEVTAAIEAIDFTPYVTTENLNARNYVSDEELADALEALDPRFITPAEREKLGTVAPNATANATDAALRDRTTHTGVQTTASISDLREYIEDTIGGMLRAVGADLNISYDDANSEITIDYTGVTNDPEAIRDSIGAAMVGLGNISVLVDDNADTITIVTSATVNSTDAALRDRSTHTGTQPAATISDLASVITTIAEGVGTSASTPHTVVRRNVNGWANFSSVSVDNPPASADQITRKDYVDAIGTTVNTASAIVRRDSNSWIRGGRIIAETPTPTQAQEVTRKDYVDALGTSAADPNTVMRRDANGYTNANRVAITDAPSVASHATRKDYVDALGSTTNVADTIVRRDASGHIFAGRLRATAASPSTADEVTRKDYVDVNGASRPSTTGITISNGTISAPAPPAFRQYTLASNITSFPLSTLAADRAGEFTALLVQDATGGRTVTMPAINWIGPTPVMPTAPGASLLLRFFWTGSTWYGFAPEFDLAAATSTDSVSTLLRRDANKNAFLNRLYLVATTPSGVNEAVRKDYVDAYGSQEPANQSTLTSIGIPTTPQTRTVTLGGNATITSTPGGQPAGTAYTVTFILKQPASGGPYTVTFPTVEWAGDAPPPVMPTPANAELMVQFIWTGAAWRGSVVGVFFP